MSARRTDETSVLPSLVDEPDAFLAEAYGRDAKVSRAVAGRLTADLASAECIEGILASGLRTPSLRIVKDGQTLSPDAYGTSCDGDPDGSDMLIDTDAVLRALANGHTVVVRALHRLDRRFAGLAASLAEEIGDPVRIFAYMTPAGNQGLGMHYDTHDVFAVQCEGSKEWAYAPGEMVRPLPEQAWHLIGTNNRERAKQTVSETTDVSLSRDDVLYLPRGFLHSARSDREFSLHLAISVHPVTVYDTLRQIIRAASEREPLRRSVAGSDPAQLREALIAEMASVIESADVNRMLEKARAQAWGELPPPALNIVRQFKLAQATPDESIELRRGAKISVRRVADRIEVQLGGARVLLPLEVEPAVAPINDGDVRGLLRLKMEDRKTYGDVVRALTMIGVLVPTAAG